MTPKNKNIAIAFAPLAALTTVSVVANGRVNPAESAPVTTLAAAGFAAYWLFFRKS